MQLNMAKVETCRNIYDHSFDGMPAWKKEIIMKRRKNDVSNGKIFRGNFNVYKNGSIEPDCSIQGQSQLCLRSGEFTKESDSSLKGALTNRRKEQFINHASVCCTSSAISSEIKNKVFCNLEKCDEVKNNISSAMKKPQMMADWGGNPEDGEIEYGPGIVSRLKHRYMSLALREAKSRSCLRRYSSLEDLLDEPQLDRGRSSTKAPTRTDPSTKKDSMKRARSVDSLAYRNQSNRPQTMKNSSISATVRPTLKSVLETENIVVVGSKQEVNREVVKSDLPTPDLVKNVKQIFEVTKKNELPSLTNDTKQPLKSKQLPSRKPPVKAKPPQLRNSGTQKKNVLLSNTNMAPPKLPAKNKPISSEGKSNVIRNTGPPQPRLHSPPTSLPSSPPRSHKPIISNSQSTTIYQENKKNTEYSSKNTSIDFIGNSLPIKSSTFNPSLNCKVTSDLPHSQSHTKGSLCQISRSSISSISNPSSEDSRQIGFNISQFGDKSSFLNNPIESNCSLQLKAPMTISSTLNAITDKNPNKAKADSSANLSNASYQDNSNNAKQPYVNRETLLNKNNISSVNYHSDEDMIAKEPCVKPDSPTQTMSDSTNCNLQQNSSSILEVLKIAETKALASDINESPQTCKSTSPSLATNPSTSSTMLKSQTSLSSVSKNASSSSNAKCQETDSPKPQSKQRDKGNRPQSLGESTSLVFNFSKRTETPDYIENDGVDLSKRQFKFKNESGYVIMPGYDGRLDSSTDETDDLSIGDSPSSTRDLPCDLVFEGAGVIIGGISNLQRQPKSKKLEVSFDMDSTSTFEYPSENFLLVHLQEERGKENPLASPDSASQPQGFLGTYTPSKVFRGEGFELGVSRSVAPLPPTPPKSSSKDLGVSKAVSEPQIRPAGESEILRWSNGKTSDLLF